MRKNPINPFNPLLKKSCWLRKKNPFNPFNPLLKKISAVNPFNPFNPLLKKASAVNPFNPLLKNVAAGIRLIR